MEKHYGIHIEYTFPDAQETTDLVRAKGMFSFYEDGHQECCRVRKVPRAPCVALAWLLLQVSQHPCWRWLLCMRHVAHYLICYPCV